jgi:hypothetical protein
MALKLHRRGNRAQVGPCRKRRTARDEEGVSHAVVTGPRRPRNPAAVIEGTGQPLYPAIEFEAGRLVREESREMARAISEGRLMAKQQRGIAATR